MRHITTDERLANVRTSYALLMRDIADLMAHVNERTDAKVCEQPHIRAIMDASANFYGIPTSQMIDRNRTTRVVIARQVAMSIARKITKQTLDEIGQQFGRDHGTVTHAVVSCEDRLSTGKRFVLEYAEVLQRAKDAVQAVDAQRMASPANNKRLTRTT